MPGSVKIVWATVVRFLPESAPLIALKASRNTHSISPVVSVVGSLVKSGAT